MNKRLQQFLQVENVTQSQFAENIGVARASVSHILSGRNKPGFEFLEGMVRHYPALNLDWFLTGRGRMFKSSVAPENPESEPQAVPSPEETAVEQASEPSWPEGLFPEEPLEATQRSIERVVVFYSDGTFQELK